MSSNFTRINNVTYLTTSGDLFFGGDLDQIGRFNGVEWEEYDYEDFLPDFNGSQFIGFTEDLDGNVYFNTQRDGTFKLENNIWVPLDNAQTQAFDNETDYFYIDQQNKSWLNNNIDLSVSDNGNIQSTTISEYTIEANRTSGIHKDTDGRMYFISYSNENMAVKDADDNWSLFPLPTAALPFETFNDILFNAENDIWLASIEGLHHYDGTAWTFNALESCKSFAVDTQGKIYVIAIERIYIIENGVISEYNTTNSPITAPYLSGHGVDSEDNLWIATGEVNTIYKVSSDGTWTTFTDSDYAAISNPKGNFHFDAAGNVWVSDSQVGAIKYDGTTWFNPFIGNFDEIENIDVESIESDATGKMYFAHHYGVVTLLNDEWGNLNIEDIPHNFSHNASIKFDDKGTLWYANTRYGVFSYTSQTITNIYSEIEAASKFTIYPNPVLDYFNIGYTTNEKANLTASIYNSLGQLQSILDLGVLPAGDYQQTVNVADLPKGFYSVQIQVNDKSYAKTMIVQ
ncbi:MAG: sugar lactone lactonase YvrE [Saprospiraceae bacterium]